MFSNSTRSHGFSRLLCAGLLTLTCVSACSASAGGAIGDGARLELASPTVDRPTLPGVSTDARAIAPSPPAGGWQEDRRWTSAAPIGRIEAQMIVPAMSGPDQIYFMPAVKSGSEMFLPALGRINNGWAIQAYYIRPDGTWLTSPSKKVNPGDTLTFTIERNPSKCRGKACLWSAAVRDATNDAVTAVDAYTGTSFTTAYGGVLAGYPSACSDLPSRTVKFVNLHVFGRTGSRLLPRWAVGDSTGVCGWSTSSPSPTTVDLVP